MARKTFPTNARLEQTDFSEAYTHYSGQIYGYLVRRTHDSAQSQDLTSVVFQKAWTARGSFHGGSIKAWLYTITRHVLADYWRSQKTVAVEDIEEWPDDGDSLDAKLDKKMELERLSAAVRKLPDEMRLIITQRFIEGKSARQTARALGISEANVRVIQYRALKRLRGLIDEK